MRRFEVQSINPQFRMFLEGDFIAFLDKREVLWYDSRDGRRVVKSDETDVANLPERDINYITQSGICLVFHSGIKGDIYKAMIILIETLFLYVFFNPGKLHLCFEADRQLYLMFLIEI